jgi:hypothetical protein
LHQDFDRPLRQKLKSRFNRFAILRKWDFRQPQNCVFELAKITEQGGSIPAAVESKIVSDLFDQNEFKNFVLNRAKDSDFVGSLMDDLIEPPPPDTGEAIPFLGETKIYESILDIAAEGHLVLNVSGTWIGRRPEDATTEDARRYIRSKAFRTGQEMRQIQLGLPGSVGGGTVTAPKFQAGSSQQGAGATVITGTPPTGATGEGTVFSPTGSGVQNEGQSQGEGSSAGSPQPVFTAETTTRRSDEPATGLNLSGSFETWGILSSQSIEKARIEFSGLTAQQVKQILQRIPSAFKATLEVEFKEGGEQ